MTGSSRTPLFHRQLKFLARWLFAVYHDIRVEGAEHVPSEGAAIVAANHPTYLDPAFLMVGVRRPIRFMAWERPFRLPGLGALMRAYGAIPVDMKKPGKESFQAAVRVLRGGEVFGIFPEGGRTKGAGEMNPFKSGVARLALITGAPIVPATIVGGQRVWRRGDWLPKPGPITVVFHPPLRVPEGSRELWRRDRTLEGKLMAEVLEAIGHTLKPALRREERVDRLLEAAPPPALSPADAIPLLFAAALPREHRAEQFPWMAGYAAALGTAWLLSPAGWWTKAARHWLPWAVLAGAVHAAGGAPRGALAVSEAVAALMLMWMLAFRFPLYRRARGFLLLAAYGGWLFWLWGGRLT